MGKVTLSSWDWQILYWSIKSPKICWVVFLADWTIGVPVKVGYEGWSPASLATVASGAIDSSSGGRWLVMKELQWGIPPESNSICKIDAFGTGKPRENPKSRVIATASITVGLAKICHSIALIKNPCEKTTTKPDCCCNWFRKVRTRSIS